MTLPAKPADPMVALAAVLGELGAAGHYRRRQWTQDRLLMKFWLPEGLTPADHDRLLRAVAACPGVTIAEHVPTQINLLVTATVADRLDAPARPALENP